MYAVATTSLMTIAPAIERVLAAAREVAAIDWQNVRLWIPDVAVPLDELRSALADVDKLSKA